MSVRPVHFGRLVIGTAGMAIALLIAVVSYGTPGVFFAIVAATYGIGIFLSGLEIDLTRGKTKRGFDVVNTKTPPDSH